MYFIIKYNAFNKYIINVTTTEINTCKKEKHGETVQHAFAGKTHVIFCLALVQDKKISHR